MHTYIWCIYIHIHTHILCTICVCGCTNLHQSGLQMCTIAVSLGTYLSLYTYLFIYALVPTYLHTFATQYYKICRAHYMSVTVLLAI